jgi:hypothetical protein
MFNNLNLGTFGDGKIEIEGEKLHLINYNDKSNNKLIFCYVEESRPGLRYGTLLKQVITKKCKRF